MSVTMEWQVTLTIARICQWSSGIKVSLFAHAKTKAPGGKPRLISAFVSNNPSTSFPKIQASNLLWRYSLVCAGPIRNPEDRFSCDTSRKVTLIDLLFLFQFYCQSRLCKVLILSRINN